MKMDEGIDTGDIYYTVKTDIGINETSAELFDRLSVIGADALIHTIKLLENGTGTGTKTVRRCLLRLNDRQIFVLN